MASGAAPPTLAQLAVSIRPAAAPAQVAAGLFRFPVASTPVLASSSYDVDEVPSPAAQAAASPSVQGEPEVASAMQSVLAVAATPVRAVTRLMRRMQQED